MKPLILILSLLTSPLLAAQEAGAPMPSYDVIETCRGQPNVPLCIESQYTTRDFVVRTWASLSRSAKSECARLNPYHDYFLLWGCVGSHEHD